jgi:hypothetical protein
MPNNLTPEYVIVPRVATKEIYDALNANYWADRCGEPSEFDDVSAWTDALKAAPPHNLIAVDKGEWERLQNIAREYDYTIKACQMVRVDWKSVHSEIDNLKLAALEQKQ